MKYIDIIISEVDNPAVAQIDRGYYIEIDFHQVKIEACYQHRDFIEMVARVINHEMLHYAIAEIADNETSCKFDRIASDLKDYWGW